MPRRSHINAKGSQGGDKNHFTEGTTTAGIIVFVQSMGQIAIDPIEPDIFDEEESL